MRPARRESPRPPVARLALGLALALGALAVVAPGTPSVASIDHAAPAGVAPARVVTEPLAWPAIAGMDTLSVMELAHSLPLSAEAVDDQPYCAPDREIAAVLAQDFEENLIDTRAEGSAPTQLWASAGQGTWTLVMGRADKTSCVVASGIGYRADTAPSIYYEQAGLRG